MNKEELKKLKTVSLYDCNTAQLTDLCDITIDNTLSVPKKTESFFQQIQNPYLFKVGDIIMKVEFSQETDFFDAIVNFSVKDYH